MADRLAHLQRLSEIGILAEAKPGHVLECHVNGPEVGWHCLRTTRDFLTAWPTTPKLIPNVDFARPYIGLFSENGVEIFEYQSATLAGGPTT